MQKKIILSVVIPTYNRSAQLNKCLSALTRQTLSNEVYEIIIIDDGSTDNTKRVVTKFKKKHCNIRYFYQKNKGHSIARNKGIVKSRGEIITFTDDDCIVTEDWVEGIIKTFKDYPYVAAVGGPIINIVDTKLSWAAHILDFSSWQKQGCIRRVKDVPTANVAYKREKIRGMCFEDDKRAIGYRDSLFNYELKKRGGTIVFNPDLIVYHNKRIKSFQEFLNIQKRRGTGFALGGYKVHGLVGYTLFKFECLNLLCPRLLSVFYRCLKSKKLRNMLFKNLSLVLRGEIERSKTIIGNIKKLKTRMQIILIN